MLFTTTSILPTLITSTLLLLFVQQASTSFGWIRPDELSITESVNNFGTRLLAELNQRDNDKNVVFSPMCVSAALTMVMNGAGGDTQMEIFEAIDYKSQLNQINEEWRVAMNTESNNNGNNTLVMASKLLIREGVEMSKSFESKLEKYFGAGVETTTGNFLERINDWVGQVTNGIISQLLDEVSPELSLTVLNAVYFNGVWETKFRPEDTRSGTFYNLGVAERQVEMMYHKRQARYGYSAQSGGFKALELPYSPVTSIDRHQQHQNSSLVMLILLPDQYDGLPKLLSSLDSFKPVTILMEQLSTTRVDIYLPKFKVDNSYDLTDNLDNLGIKNAFNKQDADLSPISDNKIDLFVSNVIHRASVEIGESGTKAAATTGTFLTRSLSDRMEEEFRVDHPFVYFIVDKRTGICLFIGTVNIL